MTDMASYKPCKVARCEFIEIRSLKCHVRRWGPADAPPLVLLHGSRDCGATFQFMIDAFARDYHFIAPDWRGYGRTDWNPQGYWFQDYLVDLDLMLDALVPDTPVTLIGHSLGGQVAARVVRFPGGLIHGGSDHALRCSCRKRSCSGGERLLSCSWEGLLVLLLLRKVAAGGRCAGRCGGEGHDPLVQIR